MFHVVDCIEFPIENIILLNTLFPVPNNFGNLIFFPFAFINFHRSYPEYKMKVLVFFVLLKWSHFMNNFCNL